MYKTHKLIGLGKHERTACTVPRHRRRIRKVEQLKKLSGLSLCRFLGESGAIYAARAPPPFRFEPISKRKGESRMAEREKYCIALNGQVFEVSRELYEAYYTGRRKEKYFARDLKEERIVADPKTGQVTVVPSREDSYERLLEAEKQFAQDAVDVEDAAIRAVMLEKLNQALHTLTDGEAAIIHALFYQEISEAELAKRLGMARTTLQSRKYRILDKLKKLL